MRDYRMQPDLLPKLVEASKAIAGKPQWHAPDSTWLRLTAALDIDGGTVEGLELRGGATQTLPDRAVRFQLQYTPPRGPCTPLVRVEWRPLAPHTNPNIGEHPLMRIAGSHVHPFDLNWLTEFGRMRGGNLVTARPLNPDPASYEEFLALVGKECRISGLERLEKPTWRLSDLFGM